MPKALRLSAGEYRAEIYPDNGGSLGRLFWRDEALLQSSADPQRLRDPSSVGMFPMVPFGGRVADAKFDWRGKCHALAAHPGESHAVHGNAWMEQWTVEDAGRTQARLTLESTCGPLAYRAGSALQSGHRRSSRVAWRDQPRRHAPAVWAGLSSMVSTPTRQQNSLQSPTLLARAPWRYSIRSH
jgi:hypothetical protein